MRTIEELFFLHIHEQLLYYFYNYLFFIFFALKGIVHPKMKILSSFTHPQVVPNLYECLCSAEHKGRYSEECGKQSSSGAPLTSIVFFFLLWKTMVPQNSLITNFLQNIFLCVQQKQRNSYRFGTTWGWVNDRIFIFGWTIPLSHLKSKCLIISTKVIVAK